MTVENQASSADKIFDCIIIGAGPGGLQAAIYLGRFNRSVLLIDRGGGRTAHARSIENFLTQKAISGKDIIALGTAQALSFGVDFEKSTVTAVERKEDRFTVSTAGRTYQSRFLLVSSGVRDNFPPLENIYKFLGISFFTCIGCDGYKTTGKKLVMIGNSIETLHLAFAVKEMYTPHITIILYFYSPPESYLDQLAEEGIRLIKGEPVRLSGEETLDAVELRDGTKIPCEVVLSNFGFKLNDAFLRNLPLKRDAHGFRFAVNAVFESSMSGLYIVGPLNTGADQAIVAAGEGAVAAIDINKRIARL